MRQLILLRHAHAESATAGQDDIARPLSATGLAEARAAGDWLREHGLRPDRVLCSTAARTRETLAALPGTAGQAEVRLRRRCCQPSTPRPANSMAIGAGSGTGLTAV